MHPAGQLCTRTWDEIGRRQDSKVRVEMLLVLLIVLLLVVGGGGYALGPGLGYYGGGGLDLVILLVILFLVFGRGRDL